MCWKLCKEYKWEVILICEKSYLDLIILTRVVIMGNGSVMCDIENCVPYGAVIIIWIGRQKKVKSDHVTLVRKTSVNHLFHNFHLYHSLIISNQNNSLILPASSNETAEFFFVIMTFNNRIMKTRVFPILFIFLSFNFRIQQPSFFVFCAFCIVSRVYVVRTWDWTFESFVKIV